MTRTKPLTKDSVTQGSQIVLPAYPILFLMAAGFLIFQDPKRTGGDAWEVARILIDIPWWGVFFLVIGAIELIALVNHWRLVFVWALVAGSAMAGFWAVIFFASAYRNETVSWTSGLWVAFAAVAHLASVRSLARYEVRI